MAGEIITVTSQQIIMRIALYSRTSILNNKGETKMDYIMMTISPIVGPMIDVAADTGRPALAG